MARKKKLAVRHRNKKGQFSKRGKRERVYSHAKTILRRIAKRERAKEREAKQRAKQLSKQPPPETGNIFEWVVSYSYEKSGRSFDVIVTARDEAEAYEVATDFLQHDKEAQRIVRSGMKGWLFDIAKGARTNVEIGNAEYRNQSKA